MKCEVKKVYNGAVSGTDEVTILLPDPNCDWVMFNFAVKNDKVVITVESGSCG